MNFCNRDTELSSGFANHLGTTAMTARNSATVDTQNSKILTRYFTTFNNFFLTATCYSFVQNLYRSVVSIVLLLLSKTL